MVREFKKTGVAVALTGALLATASMTSQATVQLSEPGDVLLVPYVLCDPSPANGAGQINTLVGLITFDKGRIGLRKAYPNFPASGQTTFRNFSAPWALATRSDTPFATNGAAPLPGTPSAPSGVRETTLRQLHWYFYDVKSNHLVDGQIPVTDNDFVRFDWCSYAKALDTAPKPLLKTTGYLLFASNDLDPAVTSNLAALFAAPSFAVYGHAYMIQGNWASQAFIPVLPNPLQSYNTARTSNTDPNADYPVVYANVGFRSGDANYPGITRLLSGTNFTHTGDQTPRAREIFMRYFLDEALATENRMVFWFNFNAGTYENSAVGALGYPYAPPNLVTLSQARTAGGEVYNSEQTSLASISATLNDELNVLVSTPTAPYFPGMTRHTETEGYTDLANPTAFAVKNTGIVRFRIPEAVMAWRTASTDPAQNSNVSFVSSGVSFNMVGLGAGGNPTQLQTEMSTEGSSNGF